MKSRFVSEAAILAVALAVGGCASTGPEVWSTRDQSAPAAPQVSPGANLDLPAPVADATPAALNKAAIDLLLRAADSPNPLLKANAIEALHAAPEFLDPVLRDAVISPNRGVRFVAAMTVGKLRMKQLVHLVAPLTLDDSDSVRAAAIFALQRCFEPVNLDPLAEFVVSDDPEVRANAAFILGELADPSAVPLLRTAASRPLPLTSPVRSRIVELQIAEALVKLGATREVEAIEAALFAPAEQGEIVALACQMLGRLKDGNAAPNLFDFASREGPRQQPPEIRIAAAQALAEIDPSRTLWEVPARYLADNRPELRAQAAYALGVMRAVEMGGRMGALLDDSNPLVQISAAAGILRLHAADEGVAGTAFFPDSGF